MSNDNEDEEETYTPKEIKSDFLPITVEELTLIANESIKDFAALLAGIDTVDVKLKSLWKQIHDNAVTDRKNAYIVWNDLYAQVAGDEEGHFKHGTVLAKYMERMEKANEQILKLAALVEKASPRIGGDDDLVPSANDIFARNEKKFRKSQS
jgi:hypothetical protein